MGQFRGTAAAASCVHLRNAAESTVHLRNVFCAKTFRRRTVDGDAGLAGVVFQMCTVGYVAFRSHTVEGAAGAVCREAFRVCAGER